MKSNFLRLAPATERETPNAEDRRARRQAEESLRGSEERFRSYFELGLIGMTITSPTKGIIEVNGKLCESLGYEREELLRMTWSELTHPDDLAADVAQFDRVMAGEIDSYSLNKRWIRKDGLFIHTTISVKCLRRGDGSVDYFVALVQDITKRKQAEEARQQSEIYFQSLIENSTDVISIFDANAVRRYTSPSVERLLGFKPEELRGQSGFALVHPDDIPSLRTLFRHEIENPDSVATSEFRIQHKDGSWRVVEGTASNLLDNPAVAGIVINSRDITDRQRAEDALSVSEERYRSLFEANPLPMWVYDLETLAFLAVNDAAILHYGYSRKEFLSKTIKDIRSPETVPALLKNVFSVSRGIDKAGVWKHQKKDGTNIDVEVTSHGFTFAGRPAELVLAQDVTERRRIEEIQARRTAQLALRADVNAALAERGAPLRRTLERCTEAVVQHLGAAFARIWTLNKDENVLELQTSSGLYTHIDGPHARVPVGSFKIGLIAEERLPHITNEVQSDPRVSDKEWAKREGMIAFAGYPLIVDDRVVGVIAMFSRQRLAEDTIDALGSIADTISQDIERKRAEEALGMSEEHLRQSQKLEAVGQLAGGIAHDFNNLLTVINGYSDLSMKKLEAADPMRLNLQEIKKAGERAASLTRQLLAFSRKQVLQPKVLDLNLIITELEKMLRRLIGEDIDLRTAFDPHLGSIKADPGQLGQVLMNLVVNARDAMPNGGKLTIETRNVRLSEEYASHHVGVVAGSYVLLALSDSGSGMDEQTQARIFEPFFTTKDTGKGTGLGLSTVYGIVKQSGGNIWVYSELGLGTTFKVYLPRVNEGAEEYRPEPELELFLQGSETILLAEDEEMVRKLAREILVMYGYQVLEAASGGTALLICEQHDASIDLLLTDVVMPEMSGRKLADRLAELRPEMKVLYMSGYADNAIVHQGVLEEGTNFIQKPFAPDDLAGKVRKVLDA